MTELRTVAALFVDPKGPYASMDGVEIWTKERDARLYDGPHPVVAHPPCERWGKYWFGGPHPKQRRRELGDDDGCFAAAIEAVRRFGGVLEHPEHSRAWRRYGIAEPRRDTGWITEDLFSEHGGMTCYVEQGHYGHRTRKPTWLYAVCQRPLQDLRGDKSECSILPKLMIDCSGAERKALLRAGALAYMSKLERRLTPKPFAELLVTIARLA